MIVVKGLTKRYGDNVVVDDFHMSVNSGDSVALWGPNGAGKTTVILCLLGLVSYEGEITVEGLDAASRGKAVRSLIGYVPQELSFYDDMRVVDLLDYSASLRGIGQQRVDGSVAVEALGESEGRRQVVAAGEGGGDVSR